MFVLTSNGFSQTRDTSFRLKDIIAKDSLNKPIIKDSVAKTDSTKTDTLASKSNGVDTLGIKISQDALPNIVTAEAQDSAVLNMRSNIFDLYGKAKVNYEDMQLDAHKVSYHQSSNIVTASLSTDSAIAKKTRPSFTQGKEKFTYDSLQYNFKTKRAIVRNVRSQYGEGYVFSQQVKRNPDQSIYGYKNVYTTCALDEPHFGISARKIKIIPGRVVASGSANFNLEGIPTPAFLPFGLFPITEGQRSGFKLPTYTIEEKRGLGLLGGGYYFNISQRQDLLVDGSFYSKGSWAVNAMSNYANRYRYSGALQFNYAYSKTGEAYESNSSITKDYKIRWDHHTDPKAHPGVGFNASVDVGTSTYNANNSFNAADILNNQYQSNITFTKQWANKPFSLSVSARHNQNTQTRLVNVTLPEINFFVSQFNPLHSKKSVGVHWYDKFTMQYTLAAVNQTSFYDSTFAIDKVTKYNYKNGLLHTIPVSATYNVARFINMTVGGTYKEYWETQQLYRYYNSETAKEDTIRNKGFFTARDFDAHIDLNTRIYGVKMFKKGKIMGIRHVLTPGVGLAYVPDYAKAPFRYGYQTRLDPNANPVYLPVYEGGVPGVPGMGQFGNYRSALNFGIDNNLQIKVRSTKDSTGFKNIRLIDNFRINSSYNFAADSFNLAVFNVSFATMLFNTINISANANFDPYAFDYAKEMRSKELMWNGHGGVAKFQNASVSIGGSLRPKKAPTAPANLPARKTDEFNRLMQYGRYDDYADFNVPFNMSFSYTLGLTKQYNTVSKRDTLTFSQHYIGVNGDVNISPRWKLMVRTGFDMTSKQLQLTSIDVIRDLHCWEMKISTIPFGARKSYTFTLQVKAQVLSDLKITRRKDYHDAL
ncbi:MAG: LPS-assembly protein LptD [Bacteroidetes bacterium]|nr:LPS-assembly protein LptD [Bacteroidota bacterium]